MFGIRQKTVGGPRTVDQLLQGLGCKGFCCSYGVVPKRIVLVG